MDNPISRAEIEAQYRADVPTHLYKYRSGRSCDLENLKNGVIWCPSFSSLGDPDDGQLEISIDTAIRWHNGDVIGESDEYGELMFVHAVLMREGSGETAEQIKEYYERERERIRSSIAKMGVYCLSKHPDNALMWDIYGGGHFGFCIEYAYVPALFDPSHGTSPAIRIHYIEKYPRLDLGHILREPPELVFWNLLARKHKRYEHEAEFRVTYQTGDRTEVHPAPISGIIFGSRATDKMQADVREALAGQSAIRFGRSKRAPKSFSYQIAWE